MAALGTSSLSLLLSVYNTSQISNIKQSISSIIGDGVDREILQPPTPEPVEIISTPIEPLKSTTFSISDSPEVAELQDKLSDLERFSNNVGTQSSTNANNIVIKGDELSRLSGFVTESLVSVRQRTADSENAIQGILTSIEIIDGSIDDLVKNLAVTNERIDTTVSTISDVDGKLSGAISRIDALDVNAAQLASDITDVVLSVDQLGDNISLVNGAGIATQESLENLYDSWNAFNSTAFVANNRLDVTSIRALKSNIGLVANKGEESAIHFAGLDNPNWSMYLANGSGKTTSGGSPRGYGSVSGSALRMRLDGDSTSGFMMENDSGVGIFSVSSLGQTQIMNGRIGDILDNVPAFGYRGQMTYDTAAISQDNRGTTRISSALGRTISFAIDGVTRAYVSDTSLTIKNGAINTDVTKDTIFNSGGTGRNYIRANTGESTYFSFGNKGASIKVEQDEITIAGLQMKTELEALKARVATLEAKDYVLNGHTVHLKNHNNSKYVRKASNSDDVIVDTTALDTRASFWIQKA